MLNFQEKMLFTFFKSERLRRFGKFSCCYRGKHAAKLGTFHDFSSLIDHNIFIFMVVSVSLLAQETRHNENSINASFMYV